MMKRYLAAAAVAALAMGTITGCGSGRDVGRDAALQAALKDAGVSEADTTRLRVSTDNEDGRRTYDVQFHAAGKEYDYEILASDGKILSSDVEIDTAYLEGSQGNTENDANRDNSAAQDNGANQNQTDQSGNAGTNAGTNTGTNTGGNAGGTPSSAGSAAVAVTQEEAARIALDRVQGASEQDIRISLDYDDGMYKYEGDIIYDNREYDFEIDANTGTILEWSEERV